MSFLSITIGGESSTQYAQIAQAEVCKLAQDGLVNVRDWRQGRVGDQGRGSGVVLSGENVGARRL